MIYSSHSTREEAEFALEEYYATGEVFESEVLGIKYQTSRRKWCVILKG
jgi:hypothetical protein